jgi:hypothetical protein
VFGRSLRLEDVPAIDVMAATGAEGKERKALLKGLLGDVHDARAQADANSTLRHAVLLALSGPVGTFASLSLSGRRRLSTCRLLESQHPYHVRVAIQSNANAQYLCTSIRNCQAGGAIFWRRCRKTTELKRQRH